MGTNLYSISDINLGKWAAFTNGHWQKEMPTKPGTYPTASRDGVRSKRDCFSVFSQENGSPFILMQGAAGQTSFDGWWWSESYPALPEPPEWDATVPSPTDVTGWGVVGQE